ncbi:ubiquitin protein ligase, putative [Entamoeba invadens IP1]|uniref:HECT-type E3 ubiquitin transferase n=1 Tax=Entamoeba invadens IP1 TaxID=370355 RepID=A0A0A1U7P7_ENTIV|nr:ubiquitin protein ligase, putative [Entamoeba invadens IP1]ELP88000.1 ubiquitin protein ligase, putative [Entamoeba invadens IP1]|eukprot:XP_004254771.1 ubiquitin protein ligase, putative [Entamoeba invadens IP1]
MDQLTFFRQPTRTPSSLDKYLLSHKSTDIDVLTTTLLQYLESPQQDFIKQNKTTLFPIVANSIFNYFYHIKTIKIGSLHVADFSEVNIEKLVFLVQSLTKALFTQKNYFRYLEFENVLLFKFFERYLYCESLVITSHFLIYCKLFNTSVNYITPCASFIYPQTLQTYTKVNEQKIIDHCCTEFNTICGTIDLSLTSKYTDFLLQLSKCKLKEIYKDLSISRMHFLFSQTNEKQRVWNDAFCLSVVSYACPIPDGMYLESYQFPFFVFEKLFDHQETCNLFFFFEESIFFQQSLSFAVKKVFKMLSSQNAFNSQDLKLSQDLSLSASMDKTDGVTLSDDDIIFIKRVVSKISGNSEFRILAPFLVDKNVPEEVHRILFSAMEQNTALRGSAKNATQPFYDYLTFVNKNGCGLSLNTIKIYTSLCSFIYKTTQTAPDDHIFLFVDFFLANMMNYEFIHKLGKRNDVGKFYMRFVGVPVGTKIFEKTISALENMVNQFEDIGKVSESKKYPLTNTKTYNDEKNLAEVITFYTSFVECLRNSDAFSGDEKVNGLLLDLIALSIRYGAKNIWNGNKNEYRNIERFTAAQIKAFVNKCITNLDMVAVECNAQDCPEYLYDIAAIDDKYRISYSSSVLFSETKNALTGMQHIYDELNIKVFEESVGEHSILLFVRTLNHFKDVISTFGSRFEQEDAEKIIMKKDSYKVPLEYFRTYEDNEITTKNFLKAELKVAGDFFENILKRIKNKENVEDVEFFKMFSLLNKLEGVNSNEQNLFEVYEKDSFEVMMKYICHRYYTIIEESPLIPTALIRYTSMNILDKRWRKLCFFDYILYTVGTPTTICNDLLNTLIPNLMKNEFEKESCIILLLFLNCSNFISFKEEEALNKTVAHFDAFYDKFVEWLCQQEAVPENVLKIFTMFIENVFLNLKEANLTQESKQKLFENMWIRVLSPLNLKAKLPIEFMEKWMNVSLFIACETKTLTHVSTLELPYLLNKDKTARNYFLTMKKLIEELSESERNRVLVTVCATKVRLYLNEKFEEKEELSETGVWEYKERLCLTKNVNWLDVKKLMIGFEKYPNTNYFVVKVLNSLVTSKTKGVREKLVEAKSELERCIDTIEYTNEKSLDEVNMFLKIFYQLEMVKTAQFTLKKFIESILKELKTEPMLLCDVLQMKELKEFHIPTNESTKSLPVVTLQMIEYLADKIQTIDSVITEEMDKENLNIRQGLFDVLYSGYFGSLSGEVKDIELIKKVISLRENKNTTIDFVVREFDVRVYTNTLVQDSEELHTKIENILVETTKNRRILESVQVEALSPNIGFYEATQPRLNKVWKNETRTLDCEIKGEIFGGINQRVFDLILRQGRPDEEDNVTGGLLDQEAIDAIAHLFDAPTGGISVAQSDTDNMTRQPAPTPNPRRHPIGEENTQIREGREGVEDRGERTVHGDNLEMLRNQLQQLVIELNINDPHIHEQINNAHTIEDIENIHLFGDDNEGIRRDLGNLPEFLFNNGEGVFGAHENQQNELNTNHPVEGDLPHFHVIPPQNNDGILPLPVQPQEEQHTEQVEETSALNNEAQPPQQNQQTEQIHAVDDGTLFLNNIQLQDSQQNDNVDEQVNTQQRAQEETQQQQNVAPQQQSTTQPTTQSDNTSLPPVTSQQQQQPVTQTIDELRNNLPTEIDRTTFMALPQDIQNGILEGYIEQHGSVYLRQNSHEEESEDVTDNGLGDVLNEENSQSETPQETQQNAQPTQSTENVTPQANAPQQPENTENAHENIELPPDVDRETFFDLPQEIRTEILEEFRRQQAQQQQQQNNGSNTTTQNTQQNVTQNQPAAHPQRQESTVDFIYDLDPLLREDILRNADDAMMQLLPEDLRNEARDLQRDGTRYGPINDGGYTPHSSDDEDDLDEDNGHFNVFQVAHDVVEVHSNINALPALCHLFLSSNDTIANIALNKIVFLFEKFNAETSAEYVNYVVVIFQKVLLPLVQQDSIEESKVEKVLKLILLLLYHRRDFNMSSLTMMMYVQPIVGYIFEEKYHMSPFILHLVGAAFCQLLLICQISGKEKIYLTLDRNEFARLVCSLSESYGVFSDYSIKQSISTLFVNEGTQSVIKNILKDQFEYITTKENYEENDLKVILSFCQCVNVSSERNEKTIAPLLTDFKGIMTENVMKVFETILKNKKNERKILLEIIYSFLNYNVIVDPSILKGNKQIDQFLDKYKELVEKIIRIEPEKMKTSFVLLSRYPKFLTFEAKAEVFRKRMRKEHKKYARRGFYISVHRNNIFQDSFSQLMFATNEDLKGKLKVKFVGEQGIDMGGLRKEWLRVIAESMFNPDYLLFRPTDDGQFQANPASELYSDIELYKFIGRVVGKTVYDGEFLDVNFTKSIYKQLLQQEITLSDMESVDQQYYKNLKWVLENSVEDLDMKFCYEHEEFGRKIVDDLKPNGRNIDVTDENKHEYVKLLVDYKLSKSVKKQIDLFKEGFFSVIPFDAISYFYDTELELLISGMPEIDGTDLKNNTLYRGYRESDKVIEWFWNVFGEMEQRQKVLFVQFVTGSSKVPLGGFKNLSGNSGPMPFTIQRVDRLEALPVAHTCFNTLDLPCYESFETLRDKLMMAISECNQGFGMA